MGGVISRGGGGLGVREGEVPPDLEAQAPCSIKWTRHLLAQLKECLSVIEYTNSKPSAQARVSGVGRTSPFCGIKKHPLDELALV